MHAQDCKTPCLASLLDVSDLKLTHYILFNCTSLKITMFLLLFRAALHFFIPIYDIVLLLSDLSLTKCRIFEYFILLTIATNCVVLMIAKPLPNDDLTKLNAQLVGLHRYKLLKGAG